MVLQWRRDSLTGRQEGGYAPDRMRLRHAIVDLARGAVEAGKPVAAGS
jgi:hypothetical protein